MRKNTKHTLKAREQMSNNMKGRIPWNKGMKGLQPWHDISGLIPGWNKGLPRWWKGGTPKGHIPWNKGIPMDEKTKEKDRITHLGKKHSEETKRKISEGGKGKKKPGTSEALKSRKITWELKNTFQAGEKHWNWHGGISPERELIANREKEKIWSKGVKDKDGWICQTCGEKKDLHAHHIKPWTPKAKSNYDISNGITLCRKCHAKVHGELLKKRANSGKLLSGKLGTIPS